MNKAYQIRVNAYDTTTNPGTATITVTAR